MAQRASSFIVFNNSTQASIVKAVNWTPNRPGWTARIGVARAVSCTNSNPDTIAEDRKYFKLSARTVLCLNYNQIQLTHFYSTFHKARFNFLCFEGRRGVSVDIIRKSAGWSENSSTFAKWYNLLLIEPNDFCTAVLSIKLMTPLTAGEADHMM
ncbi:hypothetical protein NQ315_005713 [Exocentrus adspersus]|uniref:Uncharacterized protein n=1 Tax=Exocentrus adspersus TaxID=1586481 RepID=A0AAV8VII7_9CUCU|nr:hypothetical protein NQ315_005713 [Exocentrus adspersus]